MARFDILLDDDGDLAIGDGDFLIGPSDDQHVAHIVLSHPGFWRQHPLVGFGISSYLKKSTADTRSFVAGLKVALASDGYKARSIDLSRGFSNFKLDYE